MRSFAELTSAYVDNAETNDNLRNIQLQGYAGVLAECTACHTTVPSTVNGGPHGLHPLGQQWVNQHGDFAEHNTAQCQTCHGADYRGSALSVSKVARTFNVDDGRSKSFPTGHQFSCYDCHNGPNGG